MARLSQLELPAFPSSERELDALLAAPSPATVRALVQCPGDIIVLGAGGKMGPTLARMARASASLASAEDGRARRVVAVSRFSSPSAEQALRESGLDVVRCDLADRASVDSLPDAANVFFLAGQKFGTRDAPASTWAANTVVPGIVADRYRHARIVAFSTGNVYPLVPVASGGAREADAPAPLGEYANSCLGRERVLEYFSNRNGTALAIIRLNYAIALRYGVLTDIAVRVQQGYPIDLAMGFANVIWQGDANRAAIECLPLSTSPPFVVNVTGAETVSIRAVAGRFAEHFGRTPLFDGTEAPDALLSATIRARECLTPPVTSLEWMIGATAEWIAAGRPLLGKPTSFERRDGSF